MSPSTPAPVAEISASEIRSLGLRAQGLDGGDRPADVHSVLRRLGAIQLDTISTLARTHELVPYSRLGPVGRDSVETVYWGGSPAQAFEYWAHAACVLPVESWPYFAFRRREHDRAMRARSGPAPRVYDEVRARLREGPVTATDLGGARGGGQWWSWSDAKVAVERLYWVGEVVCTTRRGWKRVYDLPERALPADVLRRDPPDEECHDHLVGRAVRALGAATRRDIAEYYRLRLRDVDAALARGDLVPVRVEGWTEPAWADPAALECGAPAQHRTTLLSPFDSLIWERRRMERLFAFTMLLEAYRPKAERVHGYFTMPLLTGGRLLGRVDPAREGSTLVVKQASLEEPSAVDALALALREAAEWVGCDAVRVERIEPAGAAEALRRGVT